MKDEVEGRKARRVIVPWLYLLLPGRFSAETKVEKKQRCMSEGGRVEKREREAENTELNPIRHCSCLSCLESQLDFPFSLSSLVSYHACVLVNNETRQVEKLFAHVSLKYFGRSIERDRNLCRGYARNR